jgi:hypothetical protein
MRSRVGGGVEGSIVEEVEEGPGFEGRKSREEEKGIELLYVFSIAKSSSLPLSTSLLLRLFPS